MPSELPAGMYRDGRPVDPEFAATEQLYMRACPELVRDLQPLCTDFRFPDQSVNREKYSEDPTWVLVPRWLDWAVVAFRRRDVPTHMRTSVDVYYEFLVEHVPLDDNYPHSEIRAYRGGERVFNPKLKIKSAEAKQRFRMQLSEAAKIVHVPDPQ